MEDTYHGGFCCGIRHIYEIPSYSKKEKKELKDLTKELTEDHGLIEIVLTTRKSINWHNAVKDIGYKEVSRFKNPSTGNICIVYHYCKTLDNETKKN